MTERLFYENPFIEEFDAVVTDCRADRDRFIICLDRTAFFPEGGGQGGDSGKIGDAVVSDTHEKNGEILHYADTACEVGKNVHCKLDFDKRFRRMQCHSGEHIVSGIIHSLYGFENVGFHLGDGDVTIDINGVLTDADLRKVETLANRAVAENFAVRTYFPTKEEADKLVYRSKIEINEGLRIVEFPGYDICACCAPHVRQSGQIGIIKLLDFINYKGGVRVHLLCGEMALADYHRKYTEVLHISTLLSAKQDEVFSAVERLHGECEERKKEAAALKKSLALSIVNATEPTDANLVFFEPLFDQNALRALANGALAKCGGICAAFAGNDTVGYNYVIAASSVDLKQSAAQINAALEGRGGGSSQMICGSVRASRAEIEKYFG